MKVVSHTIGEVIEAQASATPDAVAILSPNRAPLTYEALRQQSVTTRSALRAHGLGRDDRVALVVPNGPELVVALASVAAAGACAPLNPSYTEAEFDFYLSDLSAKAILVPHDLDTPARAVAQKMGLGVLELSTSASDPAGRFAINGVTTTEQGSPDDDVDGDAIAVLLHTSGTTSRPKLVPLTHRNLCSAATNLAEHLELAPADRSLTFMPLFHIQGIVGGVLAPLHSGGSIASVERFEPDSLLAWLKELAPTWYTAGPTYHQAAVAAGQRAGGKVTDHCLRFARSSSAPLPISTQQELETIFGIPMIEGYGLTETCMHTASNPLPPGQRKPGTVGLPHGGKVAIGDEHGALLAPGTQGEVLISGPSVTAGYENNPDANAQSFFGEWFRTGDLGVVDADGYLTIKGRIKELINRGGEKITPGEIDAALLSHPTVAEALAFSMPHRTLGEDVAAAIVPSAGASICEDELRDHLTALLAPHKIPRKFVVLDRLPKGPTGKPQRTGLAEKLLGSDEAGTAVVAPRDATETTVAELFREVLELDAVSVTDQFLDLGGDSLAALSLGVALEREFKKSFPAEFFASDDASVEGIARILREELEFEMSAAPTGQAMSILDVRLLAEIPLLALFAGLLPSRTWPRLARARAALTRRLSPAYHQTLARHVRRGLGTRSLGDTPENIADEFRACLFERKLQGISHFLPGAWSPKGRIHGREILDSAIAEGRGVVLWVGDLVFRSAAGKIILSRAGYPMSYLTSAHHGFTVTQFGVRFVNPIYTAAERRVVAETVVLDGSLPPERRHAEAMETLLDRLKDGKTVGISALSNDWGPVVVKMFDSSVRLARGAPGLSYETGAPLLPVFVVRDDPDVFDVTIESPLPVDPTLPRREATDAAAHAFAARLETYVSRYPGQWSGWDQVTPIS